jgi:hypothetical protein
MSTEMFTQIAELRIRFAGERYVNQSRWMNALLDLRKLCTEPAVKTEVEHALRRCGSRTLFDAADIVADLDAIATAAQVESAFEHLVIAA